MNTTPNPGSEEAVALGCSCPIIDNHYGKGVPHNIDLHNGPILFWISADCKIHGSYDIKGEENV